MFIIGNRSLWGLMKNSLIVVKKDRNLEDETDRSENYILLYFTLV